MRWMWLVVVLLVASPAAADKTAPTPAELIKRGETHEAKNEFAAAIKVYVELEKQSGQAAVAQYLQARAHYLAGETSAAETLTVKALQGKLEDSWKYKAKLLYGEIQFKKGEYHRAKDIFLGIRARTNDAARKTELERRVIETNKRFKLAERDGL